MSALIIVVTLFAIGGIFYAIYDTLTHDKRVHHS